MMNATMNTTAGGLTVPGFSISGLVARVVAWRRREAGIAATLRELDALSDRELADIGFSRWDLRRIARETHEA